MKAIYWNEADQGMTFEYASIPDAMLPRARNMHEQLVEAAAEANEELMDKYLNEEVLSEAEIKQALRLRTLANEIVSRVGWVAFKNKGVQGMFDAVIEYLPSPTEVKAIEGELESGEKGCRDS